MNKLTHLDGTVKILFRPHELGRTMKNLPKTSQIKKLKSSLKLNTFLI
jgi:hypothetical protein